MSLQTWIRRGRLYCALVLVFAVVLVVATHSEAAVCKVQFEDIGSIVGKGADINLAREDATIKCFDKKEAKILGRSSASLEKDVGVAIIDVCANIRCGG